MHLGRLYNTLGYCYSEIHHPEEAWQWNMKSEGIARKLMEQYPMGRQMSAEIVINANVNLMENLFDQGSKEEAWDRIKSFEEEAKILDYYRVGGGGETGAWPGWISWPLLSSWSAEILMKHGPGL